jgi:hypothetical protein
MLSAVFNPKWLQKLKHKRISNSSLYWYISDNITGSYKPVNDDESIVIGSEKTGMYGTNFLQISTAPEEYIAYGWYHRIHALAVSPAFRGIWQDADAGIAHNGKPDVNLNSLEISRVIETNRPAQRRTLACGGFPRRAQSVLCAEEKREDFTNHLGMLYHNYLEVVTQRCLLFSLMYDTNRVILTTS